MEKKIVNVNPLDMVVKVEKRGEPIKTNTALEVQDRYQILGKSVGAIKIAIADITYTIYSNEFWNKIQNADKEDIIGTLAAVFRNVEDKEDVLKVICWFIKYNKTFLKQVILPAVMKAEA